jgi:hypothetical protein
MNIPMEEPELIVGWLRQLWRLLQSESVLNLIAVLAGIFGVGRALLEYYRMKHENRRLREERGELKDQLKTVEDQLTASNGRHDTEVSYLRQTITLFQEVGAEVAHADVAPLSPGQSKLLESVKRGAKRMIDFDRQLDEAKRQGIWFLPSERLIPPRPSKPKFIALANLKGGVGKSTLSANLALELAQRGKRVLLVDLDWQQSLTRLCPTKGQTSAQFAGESGPVSDELLRYCGVSTDGLRDFRPIRVDRSDAEIYLLPAPYRLSLAEDLSLLSWFADNEKDDARFLVADRLLKWTTNFRPDPRSDETVALDYVIMD